MPGTRRIRSSTARATAASSTERSGGSARYSRSSRAALRPRAAGPTRRKCENRALRTTSARAMLRRTRLASRAVARRLLQPHRWSPAMTTEQAILATVHAFFDARRSGEAPDALAAFYAEDAIPEACPSRLLAEGARRTVADIRDAAERG